MRLRHSVAGVLAVAALIVVAGCARSDQPKDNAETAASGPLLAFTAITLDGQSFDGMSLSGKPVVLWFWAPWCPTCLGQAPGVRAAFDQYGGKVNIVGVAGLDSQAAMPEFVRLAKLERMTHLADESGGVETLWRGGAEHFRVARRDRKGDLPRAAGRR